MVRPAAAFVLGGLTIACFGGPAVGAISGLFWPHIGGGHTESAAVARIDAAIYGRNHTEGDRYFGDRGFGDPECKRNMTMREMDSNAELAAVLLDLTSAIKREQAQRKLSIGDRVASEALAKLPYPVLGALEGCIARSLLAPLCEANVRHIKQAARQDASVIIAQQESRSDEEMNKVWCAVNRAFAARS